MMCKQNPLEWYVEYLTDMEDRDEGTVAPSTFRKLFREARVAMNISERVWMSFSECATCASLKAQLAERTLGRMLGLLHTTPLMHSSCSTCHAQHRMP